MLPAPSAGVKYSYSPRGEKLLLTALSLLLQPPKSNRNNPGIDQKRQIASESVACTLHATHFAKSLLCYPAISQTLGERPV